MTEGLRSVGREALVSYRETAVQLPGLRSNLLVQDPTPVLHLLRVMNETHPALMLYTAGLLAVTAGTYFIEELRDPVLRAADSFIRRRPV